MDTPPPPTAAALPDAAPETHAGAVKSLAKGLRALDLLCARTDIGTVELARALQVDKGAASRILQTLESGGYAARRPSRRYAAGPKLVANPPRASAASGASIKERARPLLLKVHSLTGETAHLAIRADEQVLYLDKVDTELPLRVERPIGTLAPLHCTALGKVLLAFGQAPLPRSLVSFTSRTAIDVAALREELERIVADGFSRDDEEFSPGIRCVAAPLREGGDGPVVAVLGISGPTARIRADDLEALGTLVKQVAADFPA